MRRPPQRKSERDRATRQSHQAHVGFIDERGGLKRMIMALACHIASRQAM